MKILFFILLVSASIHSQTKKKVLEKHLTINTERHTAITNKQAENSKIPSETKPYLLRKTDVTLKQPDSSQIVSETKSYLLKKTIQPIK